MPDLRRVPKRTKHKASGQDVVRLNGRDFYLGPSGSIAAKTNYDRLIAEWLAAGRRLPGTDPEQGLTITNLVAAFHKHVQAYYVKDGKPTSEQHNFRIALRIVRQLYGATPAAEFGPLALKAVRGRMIEEGWVRRSINGHVRRIRQMFKWAAENELLPASVWHSLQSVAGLKVGRTDATESEPVETIAAAYVEAIEGHVSRQVWAMIQLQNLTGMRSTELCLMRGCDLTMTGKVWTYVPETHKTEHHGSRREIYLGPACQRILRPFLKPDLQAYLFSPRDAETERRAEQRRQRKSAVQPSQQNRRKRKPTWAPGERYTRDSYRKAIARGIEAANEQRDENDQIPHWHPHQLRHNAATTARKEGDLEVAQILLGHKKADTTEIYAARDRERAIAFMARHG